MLKIRPRPATLCALALACMGSQAAAPVGTIPLSSRNGLSFADLRVGEVQVQAQFDLGGYQTLALSAEDLKAVQAEASGAQTRAQSHDGSVHQSRSFLFSKVELGTLRWPGVEGGQAAPGKRSYFGYGLLKDYLVVVDYPKHELRLFPSGDGEAMDRECGSGRFELDDSLGVIRARVDLDAQPMNALLDTGANFSVVRPSALHLELPPADAKPSLHRLTALRLGSLHIAVLQAALVEFKAPPVDMVLGANFFQGRVLCLDGKARRGSWRD